MGSISSERPKSGPNSTFKNPRPIHHLGLVFLELDPSLVGGHVSRTCHTPGESQELPIRHGSGSLVEDRWQHWKSPHFQFLNNNQWPPAEELRLLAAGSGTHRARQEKRKTYPKSWRQFQREFLNLIKNLFLKSKVAMSWQKFEF